MRGLQGGKGVRKILIRSVPAGRFCRHRRILRLPPLEKQSRVHWMFERLTMKFGDPPCHVCEYPMEYRGMEAHCLLGFVVKP
jgi:hypothetical protein